MDNNSSVRRELRRYENRLTVIGAGVMALDVWSLIKMIMTFIGTKDYLTQLTGDPEMKGIDLAVFLVVFAAVLLFFLWIQFYIGLSARREGFGRKKGYGYLVLTVLYIGIYIISIIMSITDFQTVYASAFDGAVTMLIDTITTITMTEMVYASVRVKQFRRMLVAEGG